MKKTKLTLNAIPVFYCDEMVANADSYSPSAGKPRPAVMSWLRNRMPITVFEPRAVTRPEMYLAHDQRYVDDVLSTRAENGFGNRSAEVANSLRYTSGAMLSAAKEAIKNGQVAAAPCSGFHHAGYDFSGGFCTFNGLMIAAKTLQYEGRAQLVGIIDFDQHYGNGTDDIIDRLDLENVIHFTAGKQSRRPHDAEKFLHKIAGLVEKFADCDVILYQAGADPHIDDPLGGWMTTEQLRKRDELVFQTAKRLGIPVAWNLAGGYQKPFENVLKIHDNTMSVCANTYLQ
jgi:acetoin utilization deacetylase AcuC-like enzyme